jgi:hypothetical protein
VRVANCSPRDGRGSAALDKAVIGHANMASLYQPRYSISSLNLFLCGI